MKDTGLLILALWLITQSALRLTAIHFPYQEIILPGLALSAGIFILIHVIKTKIANIGLLLLSIWLILRSSLFLFNITFPYSDMTIAILGMVTGIMLIVKK